MSEPLPEHYASREQLEGAVSAGMWVFLATEAMIFGALLMAYTAYRI